MVGVRLPGGVRGEPGHTRERLASCGTFGFRQARGPLAAGSHTATCSVRETGHPVRPSTWRLRVRASHGALRSHRPMARPLAFQAGEDGSEPSGITAGSSTGRAERAHNPRQVGSTPTPATKASRAPGPVLDGKARHPSFRYPLMANERAVNPRLLVRVQVPERKNMVT